MKKSLHYNVLSLVFASGAAAVAGPVLDRSSAKAVVAPEVSGFANARRPITNPTLFDLALPSTNVRPIVLHHRLPDLVDTSAGMLEMGGDVGVYALQFEYAFNERFSLVATKDGFVDFNPENEELWKETTGFANLAAGLKYAWILDPARSFALSTSATIELPTGNRDVFQGEGNGAVNLLASTVKLKGPWQIACGGGIRVPFDDQLSTSTFLSAHVSYEVCDLFTPLVEINWHRVISAGDGEPAFIDQATGLVPQVARFEGSDLLNFGAGQADDNPDLVTLGLGFRSALNEQVDLGFAYEIPLTDESAGIWDDRFTLDCVWTF